ncbi:MAG: nitroreductase [Burkholderiales bacterium RIFCSPHIGHO2_01_FULL_64_960]|nr:MAG: nitroreductase [Burkholderiales bacterium RIFCSPHIGHO2_01_FULL_64_960]
MTDSAPYAISTLERLLEQRFSCRGYLPKPVDEQTIAQILKVAQRTASWCNAQPWKLIITSGEATDRFRDALVDDAAKQSAPEFDFPPPGAYNGDYQLRRKECGLALYDAVGVPKGDREASARQAMENFRLFGAPHVAIVTSDEALGVYGAVDCGAYVANFMLAARALGVASIAQAAIASRSRFVRQYFGLPDDRKVVCGISFGYEDPAHPANSFRTSRADWQSEVRFLS